MDKRQLEGRLRAIREPEPPRDLAFRLEREIPDTFQQPKPRPNPWRIETMVRIGAVAVAMAVVVWVVSLLTIGTVDIHVAYADVLGPVADATSGAGAVHMVLRMLTGEGEDFSYVNLESGVMRPVEVWLDGSPESGDRCRARLVKGDRIYNSDGQESVLYLSRQNDAYRDVGFDRNLFWPGEWVRQLQHLPPEDVVVLASEEKGGEGRLLLRARGVAMKPLEPSFFDQFDRETEIVWDSATQRLKGLRRWVEYKGERRLFSDLVWIDYQTRFDDAVFRLDLPPDVRWGGLSARQLPADQIGLGPAEVARIILEAATERDRDTLQLYVPSPDLVEWFMNHSLEVVSLGKAFKAGNYPGFYVPYEVRVGAAGIFQATKKHNLALRNDNPEGRWQLDGGW